MSGLSRFVGRRSQLLWKVALVGLVPLIGAPTCAHSVMPTFASNPPPSGDFRAAQQSVEPRLVEAHANSVLVLGLSDWKNLEPCNACSGTNCSATTYPAGWPVDSPHEVADKAGTTKYRCNYNFKAVDDYLAVHSDPNGPRQTRRHFMIQVAPVFYTNRTTPAYLNSYAFDESTMKAKFHALWDKLRVTLNSHVAGANNPTVLVGFGNEINAYIQSQSNPTAVWTSYTNFVADAHAYVKSTDPSFYTTVSTQCYDFCGMCISSSSCTATQQTELALMAQTDVLSFTYYPPTNIDSSWLAWQIGIDLNALNGAGSDRSKPVLIQEAGYPTSGALATQRQFVDALYMWLPSFSSILGVNYFSLTDMQPNVFMPTGFYDTSGAVKDQTAWNNFDAKNASDNCNYSGGYCCSMSCVNSSGALQCGSTGCGSLPGGAANCCGTNILQAAVPCNADASNAPCVPNCVSGVCCATTCKNAQGQMQCGGTGCSGFSGGAANCCAGTIQASGKYCDGDPMRAPCIRN